jgi:hypothetical protein
MPVLEISEEKRAGSKEIQRLPTNPFSLELCKEYFIVHRETLTQYITFKRGGRGESVLLYYVFLQL